MAKYSVDINGTFTAEIDVEIDDDTPEDDIQEMVYDIAEKRLHEMLNQLNYSALDNIEFEPVDHTEITD